MSKQLRKTIRDCTIPEYMIDILTGGFCDCFLRMSILHENRTYVFSYDTSYYDGISMKDLSPQELLELTNTLIKIKTTCENHLISAEDFMIEPACLWKRSGMAICVGLRLAFVPDPSRRPFCEKLLAIMERLRYDSGSGEDELLNRAREELKRGDLRRAEALLERIRSKYNTHGL
ncbi:MAG: hypothetical protein IJH91_03230 [Mogibacterium sp.]|nr:hypothetical protein [Mogibacterium sp.]